MHRCRRGQHRPDEGQVDGQRGRTGAIPGPLPGAHSDPFTVEHFKPGMAQLGLQLV
jgi:hypothetical protein